MCIRDSVKGHGRLHPVGRLDYNTEGLIVLTNDGEFTNFVAVSYTHLRAHETVLDLVCRLLLDNKTQQLTHVVHSYLHTY